MSSMRKMKDKISKLFGGSDGEEAPPPGAGPVSEEESPARKDRFGLPECVYTSVADLSSQGLVVSRDKSAAYQHESTSPPNYYECHYGIQNGVNMDRGGFGHAQDGTNFGCVFDGVTAGGKINAYAAQAFTEYTIKWLSRNHDKLRQGEGRIDLLAIDLYTKCASRTNNRGSVNPEHSSEGGSATGVMAAIQPRSADMAILNGASIGDAAAFVVHVETGEAKVLTHVFRRGKNPKDTGGQIIMCIGINGEVWSFSEPVTKDSLIILTTDGFTDNINMSEVSTLVPLILRSGFFDEVPQPGCAVVAGPTAHLPTTKEIEKIVGGTLEPLKNVTCPAAVTRLSNYVRWITEWLFQQEQEYYATLKHHVTLSGIRAPTEEEKQRKEQLELHMKDLHQLRKHGCAGKTDDAMLLVFKPFHSLGASTLHAASAASASTSSLNITPSRLLPKTP